MKPARALLFALLALALLVGGCSRDESRQGFTIYLLRGDISPTQLPALSRVEIASEPLIATADIISYKDHIITLTPSAFHRLAKLKVPVHGLPFAVCVDRNVIYTGAFWTPISSVSYDGVVIMQPLPSMEGDAIMISLGNPLSSYFNPNLTDPRGDARIMNALRAAGKLKA
jgi:hypothetical protein